MFLFGPFYVKDFHQPESAVMVASSLMSSSMSSSSSLSISCNSSAHMFVDMVLYFGTLLFITPLLLLLRIWCCTTTVHKLSLHKNCRRNSLLPYKKVVYFPYIFVFTVFLLWQNKKSTHINDYRQTFPPFLRTLFINSFFSKAAPLSGGAIDYFDSYPRFWNERMLKRLLYP